MTVVRHELHPADGAVMLAMRAALAIGPKPELAPESRPGFDAMIAKASAPNDIAFEADEVGGVAGWWCRPVGADPAAAIFYLQGGAYVLEAAAAYRHFAAQVAARAGAAAFIADYALAPERPFPTAFNDAREASDDIGGFLRDRLREGAGA